jgi:cation diffusion facilitator family transporter
MEAAHTNIRIQRIVVVVAFVLLAIKLVAYFLTHSVAILTDALESIVNVVAGLLGLYSLTVSARPRDADHPYGHGKVEFISSAIEGTMILLAGILIIYEAVNALLHPRMLHQLDYGVLLVSFTALVNYVMGSICVRTGRKNNSHALIASGKHLQTDTYSTLGIIVGLVLIYFTNLPWLDSAVAILFAGIIIITGYKIIRQSVAGIMDETDNELLIKMVAILNANRNENWIDLHNLRIIKFGPILHLDAHLTQPWYLNLHEAHQDIDALATLVRNEFGESLELFIHSDGCLEFSCKICSKQNCAVRKHPFEKRIEWTMQNISLNQKHEVNTQSK